MSLQIALRHPNIVSTYVAPSSAKFVKAIVQNSTAKERMAKAERAATYALRAAEWGITVKEYLECRIAGLAWGTGENLQELVERKKAERYFQKMSASTKNVLAINTLTDKREVI